MPRCGRDGGTDGGREGGWLWRYLSALHDECVGGDSSGGGTRQSLDGDLVSGKAPTQLLDTALISRDESSEAQQSCAPQLMNADGTFSSRCRQTRLCSPHTARSARGVPSSPRHHPCLRPSPSSLANHSPLLAPVSSSRWVHRGAAKSTYRPSCGPSVFAKAFDVTSIARCIRRDRVASVRTH